MGSVKEVAAEVRDIEERLAKLVPLLESIAKGNVHTRNKVDQLMEMQSHLIENQSMMMTDLQNMHSGITGMSEDLKKMREAILYVFELAINKGDGKMTAQELRQSARHMENLAKGGIDALAQHNAREALNFIAKIQSGGGGK